MKELGSILTRVLRAGDNAPVAKYILIIRGTVPLSTLYDREEVTSGDGEFLYDGLWPGTYRVDAASPDGVTSMTSFVIVKQKETTEVEFLFEDAAILRGVVVSETDGLPVKEFHLDLWPVEESGINGINDRVIKSDDGSFEIETAPCSYTLQVEAEGFAIPKPIKVTLKPGSEETVRVEMPEGLTIEGKVVDESGNGIAGAVLKTFGTYTRIPNPETKTDRTGSFKITSFPRTSDLRLLVSHPDYPIPPPAIPMSGTWSRLERISSS